MISLTVPTWVVWIWVAYMLFMIPATYLNLSLTRKKLELEKKIEDHKQKRELLHTPVESRKNH